MKSSFFGIFLLAAASVANAQEPLLTVSVDTSGLGAPERTAVIRQELEGLPLTIVEVGPASVMLSTSREGVERLQSLPQLRRVSVTGAMAARSIAQDMASKQYVVALKRTGSTKLSPVAEMATAGYAATVTSRAIVRGDPATRQASVPGGGILVEGLDAAGLPLAQLVISDPRILRYEAFSSSGRLTERIDLMKPYAQVVFTLPDDPRLKLVRLSAIDAGNNRNIIAEVLP